MAGERNTKQPKGTMTPGGQADKELQQLLDSVDPSVEAALETVRISEEHYFAAVHQEGNPVPTTFSSSTEL